MFDIKITRAPSGLLRAQVDGVIRYVNRNLKSSRDLYILGDYVLKLDDDLGDWHQSSWEIEFWNRVEPNDAEYFAPIIQSLHFEESDIGIGHVVQPLLKPYVSEDEDERERVLDEADTTIIAVAGKYGLWDVGHWQQNWMLCENGKPVIYDYGA
jgi:hypothetical protein